MNCLTKYYNKKYTNLCKMYKYDKKHVAEPAAAGPALYFLTH